MATVLKDRLEDADVNSVPVERMGEPDSPLSETVMKTSLPPHVDQVLSGKDAPPRSWDIDEELLDAERHFEQLLPKLLGDSQDRWVYVTFDEQVGIYDSQDDAELAVLEQGYCDSQYVVRLVSEFEDID